MASSSEPSPSVTLKNSACSVKLYTFGAHIVSFEVDGKEQLWMSSSSVMDGSKPIRGGIPIAFPQFADEGSLKLHGFARESVWTVADQTDDSVSLELVDNPTTLDLWPHRFRLLYRVVLLERGLRISLTVENPSTAEQSFSFTSCFHTYFRFPDTSQVLLSGLNNTTFIDKADDRKEKLQTGPYLNVEDEAKRSAKDAGLEHGFVDRIYLNSPNHFQFLQNDDNKKTVLYDIEQSESFIDSTIYNPWLGDKQGPKGPDFDDDGYKYTICCEPTLAKQHCVVLQEGETWEGYQIIVVPP